MERLKILLYHLMREKLSYNELDRIIEFHLDRARGKTATFSDPTLEKWADELARRIINE